MMEITTAQTGQVQSSKWSLVPSFLRRKDSEADFHKSALRKYERTSAAINRRASDLIHDNNGNIFNDDASRMSRLYSGAAHVMGESYNASHMHSSGQRVDQSDKLADTMYARRRQILWLGAGLFAFGMGVKGHYDMGHAADRVRNLEAQKEAVLKINPAMVATAQGTTSVTLTKIDDIGAGVGGPATAPVHTPPPVFAEQAALDEAHKSKTANEYLVKRNDAIHQTATAVKQSDEIVNEAFRQDYQGKLQILSSDAQEAFQNRNAQESNWKEMLRTFTDNKAKESQARGSIFGG
jgi:hypothetical protein